MLPPEKLQMSNNFIVNIMQVSKYIFKVDGYKGFYKGFFAANIKAGLGCYTYFAVLRYSG
jgi:hypothetical protein